MSNYKGHTIEAFQITIYREIGKPVELNGLFGTRFAAEMHAEEMLLNGEIKWYYIVKIYVSKEHFLDN